MIFTRASERDCVTVEEVLERYAPVFGQVVNFQESAMCVSGKVAWSRACGLASLLGVKLVKCYKRYISLPSFADEEKKKIHWCNWSKLCCSKDMGGLGFRDLAIFIKALLAKHVWCLIHFPNSLAARVLKSIYFSDFSSLLADCKSGSSYLWKSFYWGGELLEAGSHWRIGSGDTASGEWNRRLISDSFIPDDANLILSLPCSSNITSNSLVWHSDKFGAYSVKSRYHLGCNLISSPSCSSLDSSESWWKYLWRMKIPSKVKIFLWRVSHNWIPIGCNLNKRRIPVDVFCHICCRRPETSFHALWCCPSLKQEFHRANSPEAKLHESADGVNERSSNSVASWSPPGSGLFRINCDATVDSGTGKVGLGIIIRDGVGVVLACRSMPIMAGFSPLISKALAILYGLLFALDVGLVLCLVETDAQVIANLLRNDADPFMEMGPVVHDIKMLLPSVSSGMVLFVPRKANRAAHSLAKFAFSLDNDKVWLEDCPFLYPIVDGDYPPQL
ncbi:hypothetical protein Dsin_002399 [Dipteronia sinensis]|uniref:RNase H type-1 domain-containing protein n=1 Tax=Dipteronia sinensis TaxID=43782 RepID=A0AAE0B5R5_9ROSI|nr:hypothetical protein Dsin_002399 [Dipteronia sinensis]